MSRALAACAAALVALAAPAAAQADRWVASWGTGTQGAYPLGYNFDPGTASLLPGGGVENRTFRLIVRPTLGGRAVRVRLSNASGKAPVRIGAVTIGPRRRGAALRSTTPVTFNGRRATTIPAATRATSDKVPLPVAAFQQLAISIHVIQANAIEWHAMALRTNYLAEGNATSTPSAMPFATTTTGHFLVDTLDVQTPTTATTIVAFGDSLTDGTGATKDKDDRWPDALARRLRQPRAVVNRGINGNNLTARGIVTDGPNGLNRLDRDILATSGVATVVICEGSNDLSNGASAGDVIAALRTVATRLHARKLEVIGATLIPRADGRWTAAMERARQAVNAWIRTTKTFDAIADFERAVATADGKLNPRYDSGDRLHPNAAGYRAIAATVPLR